MLKICRKSPKIAKNLVAPYWWGNVGQGCDWSWDIPYGLSEPISNVEVFPNLLAGGPKITYNLQKPGQAALVALNRRWNYGQGCDCSWEILFGLTEPISTFGVFSFFFGRGPKMFSSVQPVFNQLRAAGTAHGQICAPHGSWRGPNSKKNTHLFCWCQIVTNCARIPKMYVLKSGAKGLKS